MDAAVRGRGGTIWRDDAITVALSTLVIAGLFLDGWSHLNRQGGRLGSFFTPWHGLLYAAFSANAAWVISRNRHLWRRSMEPHPALHPLFGLRLRYPFAVVGLLCATGGMLSDLVWHTLFGSEKDVARVIAPSHVLLFLGAALLIAAALRSAWYAPLEYPYACGFIRVLPAVASLTLLAAAASFLLQWLSPFMDWRGDHPNLERTVLSAADGLQVTMAARVVMAHVVLVGPLMLAARRWRLPLGAGMFLFTAVAAAMSALTSFQLGWTVLAAVAGGLAVDIAAYVTRARPHAPVYAIGIAGALVTWPAYFLVLDVAYDASWPADFALGLASLCALFSAAIGFFLHTQEAWHLDVRPR